MKAIVDTVWGYATWFALEVLSWLWRTRGRAKEEHAGVLQVSPFPPEIHGGVYRPLSFAKYASASQVALSVLTNARRDGAAEAGLRLLSELDDEMQVDFVHPDKQPSWRFFPKVDGGFIDAVQLAWYARQRYRGKLPSVVLCSGPPFNLFVVGYWLKQIWGCRLVLDYRDEWGQNPFEFVQVNRFDHWWERRCLSAADQVIFTTESQDALHKSLFPRLLVGKTMVIPNGWDASHQPTTASAIVVRTADEPVEIAFAGLLSRHTLPQIFVSALSALKGRDLPAVRLSFIGKRNPAAVSQLTEADMDAEVRFEDQIPADQVIARLNKASLLLIIANQELSRYIPGKLYYYLASQVPVLVYGEPGEVQRTVEALGAGRFIASGDHEALAAFLMEIASAQPQAWVTERRRQWVAEHTREHAAQRLFRLIEQP